MDGIEDVKMIKFREERYDLVIQLSCTPSPAWAAAFDKIWSYPFYHAWRHAVLKEDKIIIRACTTEEFKRLHRGPIEQAILDTNQTYEESKGRMRTEKRPSNED